MNSKWEVIDALGDKSLAHCGEGRPHVLPSIRTSSVLFICCVPEQLNHWYHKPEPDEPSSIRPGLD